MTWVISLIHQPLVEMIHESRYPIRRRGRCRSTVTSGSLAWCIRPGFIGWRVPFAWLANRKSSGFSSWDVSFA
ncbi:MAG: hypothetical protein ABJK93_02570 [Paracoccaceae bacterium]